MKFYCRTQALLPIRLLCAWREVFPNFTGCRQRASLTLMLLSSDGFCLRAQEWLYASVPPTQPAVRFREVILWPSRMRLKTTERFCLAMKFIGTCITHTAARNRLRPAMSGLSLSGDFQSQ